MNKKIVFSIITFVFLLFFVWFLSDASDEKNNFSERIKVALRNVGHQLLLAQKDSTSLVLPIVKTANATYRLEFQNKLSFEPGNLVVLLKKTFQKAGFSDDYLVEVIQCIDKEIAYSYEMKKTVGKSIIPCRGRFLPQNCYQIKVYFLYKNTVFFNNKLLVFLLLIGAFVLQFFFFNRTTTINKKPYLTSEELENKKFTTIGSFQFYPTQNKLVKKTVEISLSKKECELLEIFVANPNTIIKRDELTKKVWEDNGVFVGRSLDTYISKLRKKFKDDKSVKFTNIHGIGYKLEINT